MEYLTRTGFLASNQDEQQCQSGLIKVAKTETDGRNLYVRIHLKVDRCRERRA